MIGKIRVHILSARLTHDVKKIGKMDPYCRVKCNPRNLKWDTNVCKNGSKKPSWDNQRFEMEVLVLEDVVEFKLFDKDTIGKDVFIGETRLKCSDFQEMQGDREIELFYDGNKSAGILRINVVWTPNHEQAIKEAEEKKAAVDEKIQHWNKKKENADVEFAESMN